MRSPLRKLSWGVGLRRAAVNSTPDGVDNTEINAILQRAADAIPRGCDLTLDVTQGFRHFPFVAYALVLYLSAFREVRIRGVYYGLIEGIPAEQPKPILDLKPLLELPEWFHAVRVFRETGATQPLAERLQALSDELKHRAQRGETSLFPLSAKAKQHTGWLRDFSLGYEAALPLELAEPLEKLHAGDGAELKDLFTESVPLGAALAGFALDATAPFRLEMPPKFKGIWKNTVALTAGELRRQARLIDVYLARGQMALGLGLMREWMVSRVMLAQGRGEDWLERNARLRAERWLGALAQLAGGARAALLNDGQRAWGRFWDGLAQARNGLHHHGMKEEPVPPAKLFGENLKDFWECCKTLDCEPPMFGGGHGKLVITPLGNRPGVLFSALRATEPDRCLVVCSAASRPAVAEAVERSGYDGEILYLEVIDPHAGFAELKRHVEDWEPALLDAETVVANLTGGTTFMGILVQKLTEAAQRFNRPTRRFVLIDRRPPAEQDADPYVASEHCWIDEETGAQA